jgi:hypothetical protein
VTYLGEVNTSKRVDGWRDLTNQPVYFSCGAIISSDQNDLFRLCQRGSDFSSNLE